MKDGEHPASQENLEARVDLAVSCILKDRTRAQEILWEAAAEGSGLAMHQMAIYNMLRPGDTFESLKSEAIEITLRQAQEGNRRSQCLYPVFACLPVSSDEAVQWWTKSAEQGYAPAMAALSQALYETNREAALTWEERGVELGDPGALGRRGTRLINEGDESGEELLRLAAKAGDPAAWKTLSDLAVRRKDWEAAVSAARKGAKRGYAQAMFQTALLLLDRDNDEALMWARRAADLDYLAALRLVIGLGLLDHFGQLMGYLGQAKRLGWSEADRVIRNVTLGRPLFWLLRPFRKHLSKWQFKAFAQYMALGFGDAQGTRSKRQKTYL